MKIFTKTEIRSGEDGLKAIEKKRLAEAIAEWEANQTPIWQWILIWLVSIPLTIWLCRLYVFGW